MRWRLEGRRQGSALNGDFLEAILGCEVGELLRRLWEACTMFCGALRRFLGVIFFIVSLSISNALLVQLGFSVRLF